MRVTVIAARELAQEMQQKAAAAAAAAAGAADAGGAKAATGPDGAGAEGDSSCDLYCELRFLRQVRGLLGGVVQLLVAGGVAGGASGQAAA